MLIVIHAKTAEDVADIVKVLLNNNRRSFNIYEDEAELIQKLMAHPPPPPVVPIRPMMSSNLFSTSVKAERVQNSPVSAAQNHTTMPASFAFPQKQEVVEFIDLAEMEEAEEQEQEVNEQQIEENEQIQPMNEIVEEVEAVENVSRQLNTLNWNFRTVFTPLPEDAVDDSQCSPEKSPPNMEQLRFNQRVANAFRPTPPPENDSTLASETPDQSPDQDPSHAGSMSESPEQLIDDTNQSSTSSSQENQKSSSKRQNEEYIDSSTMFKRRKSLSNSAIELECTRCKSTMRFMSLSLRQLSNHSITHTDMKRYKCPVNNCPTESRQCTTIIGHLQKQHRFAAVGTDVLDCLTSTEWGELKRITSECFPSFTALIMDD